MIDFIKKLHGNQAISPSITFQKSMKSKQMPGQNEISITNHKNRLKKTTLDELGKISNRSYSPGYSFSKICRFDSDIYEQFKRRIYVEMSPIFIKRGTRRTSSRISSKDYTLTSFEKIEKIKKFSRKEEINAELSRITRNAIVNLDIQNRSEKLTEKFNRFELRRNKHDVIKVKKCWVCLFVSLGWMNTAKVAIPRRIRLKLLNSKMKLWLRATSVALGKIMIKIKKIRSTLALKVNYIKKLSQLTKYIKRWLLKRKINYTSTIVTLFQRMMDSAKMVQFLYDWREKVHAIQIIFIQKHMKRLIKMRIDLYKQIVLMWDGFELELLNEKLQAKEEKKKSKKGANKAFLILTRKHTSNFLSVVPYADKFRVIRTFARSIIMDFINKHRAYKLRILENKQFSEILIILDKKPEQKESEIPVCPKILGEFTSEIYKSIIHKYLIENQKKRKNKLV